MGKNKKATKASKHTGATEPEPPKAPASNDHAENHANGTEKGNDDGNTTDDANNTKRSHDAVNFSPHGARIAATNPHGAKNLRPMQESPCKKRSSLRHGNIYPNSEDSFGEEDDEVGSFCHHSRTPQTDPLLRWRSETPFPSIYRPRSL